MSKLIYDFILEKRTDFTPDEMLIIQCWERGKTLGDYPRGILIEKDFLVDPWEELGSAPGYICEVCPRKCRNPSANFAENSIK